MPVLDGLSPEWIYAVKTNIKFPGTQAQATAAETAAAVRALDGYGLTVTVPGGTIKIANP